MLALIYLIVSIFLCAGAGYYGGYLAYDPYLASFIKWLGLEQVFADNRWWLTDRAGLVLLFVCALPSPLYKASAVLAGTVAAESFTYTHSDGLMTFLNAAAVIVASRTLRFFIESCTALYCSTERQRQIRLWIDLSCLLAAYVIAIAMDSWAEIRTMIPVF